jgi:hypothetical protein
LTTAAAAVAGDTKITVTVPAPVYLDRRFDLTFGTTKARTKEYAWVVPTLTTSAATIVGAVTVSVTSAIAVRLKAGTTITFGTGVAASTVTVDADVTVSATGATNIPIKPAPKAIATTTASVNSIDVFPLPGAIASSAVATSFYPTLSLRGLVKVDAPNSTTLTSIRTMESGLGNEQRPTMIDYSLTLEGIVNPSDPAYTNILIPAANVGNEIYFEYYSPVGDVMRGIAIPTNISRSEAADAVVKWSGTLTVQGVPTRARYFG